MSSGSGPLRGVGADLEHAHVRSGDRCAAAAQFAVHFRVQRRHGGTECDGSGASSAASSTRRSLPWNATTGTTRLIVQHISPTRAPTHPTRASTRSQFLTLADAHDVAKGRVAFEHVGVEATRVRLLSEVLSPSARARCGSTVHDQFAVLHSEPTVFLAIPSGFELFGFDFLVNEDLGVWFLKANARTSP